MFIEKLITTKSESRRDEMSIEKREYPILESRRDGMFIEVVITNIPSPSGAKGM